MEPLNAERKDATTHTAATNMAARRELDYLNEADFHDARHGHLAGPAQRQILGRFGHAVWDHDDYLFEEDEANRHDPPSTVHPGLWRQARLNNIAGLFEVAPGIHQVRGLDISNVTFIASDSGWVVIDPLTSAETASAAVELVNAHLGERPVRAVIYTHSHTDHFGGIRGVVDEAAVERGEVELIAPAGFLEAAVSENVLAGTVMLRRATYMYGALLAKDAQGHVDTGLGKGLPAMPSVGLIAPTIEIEVTGTELTIDGLRMVFQITPGTEAPAEMNVFFPEMRALCMAENCTANMHNVYTLRGAQVRDSLGWSKYIGESIEIFGDDTDVLFASHHWPRFGHDAAIEYLASQRDAYRFVHDQTLRLANQGFTMNEIAETLALPEGLGDEFFNRGYYGTLSHNSKAVYQRYLGWFDANPAHLNPHPPVEAATRYVEFMGGADAVVARARESFEAGDYRWVAEVVNHVVFAQPEHEAARLLQADALEQLGYAAESGPWRDFYLTGAQELRSNGTILAGLTGNAMGPDIVRSMTVEMLVDLIGVRLNAEKAGALTLRADVVITDRDSSTHSLGVRCGVVHLSGRATEVADVRIEATHAGFAALASGNRTLDELDEAGELVVTGERGALEAFLACLDTFSFGFEIVLP